MSPQQQAEMAGQNQQMQQLYMQQQWIYQQMMASYQGNTNASATPAAGYPNPQAYAAMGQASTYAPGAYPAAYAAAAPSAANYYSAVAQQTAPSVSYGRDNNRRYQDSKDRTHPYSPNMRKPNHGERRDQGSNSSWRTYGQSGPRHGRHDGHPQPPPPPPPSGYRCNSCNKDLPSQVMYQAHVSAHKKCPYCPFEALNKQLSQHMAKVHGDEGEVPEPVAIHVPVNPNETPEEIAAWIEARKKRYPTDANIKEKEAKKQTEETENARPESPKKKHNPTSFKTCKYHMKGTCRKAENCPFQHSVPLSSLKKSEQSKRTLFQTLMGQDRDPKQELLLKAIHFICNEALFA
ncbi:hypothetical protein HDV03_002981 [Kappamyces sp. JEL0829]|nr:hypothetical protein HDV03_002981 [Kappamyces sp. JEL0829]